MSLLDFSALPGVIVSIRSVKLSVDQCACNPAVSCPLKYCLFLALVLCLLISVSTQAQRSF